MAFIVTIGLLVALVWCAVLFQLRKNIPVLQVNPIVAGTTMVVVIGTVFGHAFFNVQVGPIPVTLDRLLLGGVVGLFLLRYFFFFEDVKQIDRLDIVVLAWLAILVCSTFTHDYKFKDNLPLSRLLFFNLLPVVTYFLMKNVKISKLDLTFVMGVLMLLGVYLAGTAFAESRDWAWAVFPGYIMDGKVQEFLGRGRGPLHNPVINGMLINLGVCCTMLSARFFSRPAIWFALSGFFFVGLLGSYATLTRSIWISLALAMFLITWFPLNLKGRIGYGMVALALGGIGLLAVKGGALEGFKRDKYVSATEMANSSGLRTIFFVVAMDMWEDRPITGHGFGQYASVRGDYAKVKSDGIETTQVMNYYQHNIFLAYLTETGLIGCMMLLSLLAALAWVGGVLWRDGSQWAISRQFGLLLFVFVAIFFVNGMFHDVTIIPMANMLLLFLGGIVGNLYRERKLSLEVADELPKEPVAGIQNPNT